MSEGRLDEDSTRSSEDSQVDERRQRGIGNDDPLTAVPPTIVTDEAGKPSGGNPSGEE
ncbi:MAG TPA: hypothetical protein VF666_09460 [Pyrinomonadaceae bacterium]